MIRRNIYNLTVHTGSHYIHNCHLYSLLLSLSCFGFVVEGQRIKKHLVPALNTYSGRGVAACGLSWFLPPVIGRAPRFEPHPVWSLMRGTIIEHPERQQTVGSTQSLRLMGEARLEFLAPGFFWIGPHNNKNTPVYTEIGQTTEQWFRKSGPLTIMLGFARNLFWSLCSTSGVSDSRNEVQQSILTNLLSNSNAHSSLRTYHVIGI